MVTQLQDIIYIGQEIDDFDTFDILPSYLKKFYLKQNGLIAFNGGLHIRGCIKFPQWHSLNNAWFGSIKLSESFESIEINDVPFGQDCFGDQFVIRNNNIWRLSSETDQIKDLGIDFYEFIKLINCRPEEILGFHDLGTIKIKPGQLVNVFPPFCVEAKNGYSLKPIENDEQIRFLSYFSKKMKKNPNGTLIDLELN